MQDAGEFLRTFYRPGFKLCQCRQLFIKLLVLHFFFVQSLPASNFFIYGFNFPLQFPISKEFKGLSMVVCDIFTVKAVQFPFFPNFLKITPELRRMLLGEYKILGIFSVVVDDFH